MAPILYKKNLSAPCRAVLLTAKAIELELLEKEVDISSGEHLDPDYVQMNPQHTIPTLDDDGFILCDSNAICSYLVAKYGSDDAFYPADVQTRALIDHRMFYNSGTLQNLMRRMLVPIFFEGATSIDEKVINGIREAYDILEKFLGDRDWMVGENITVADFTICPSITTINIGVPIDPEVTPKLSAWIERMSELPYYEANADGLEEIKNMYDSCLA